MKVYVFSERLNFDPKHVNRFQISTKGAFAAAKIRVKWALKGI